MVTCCVPGCPNREDWRRAEKTLSFHRFPKREEIKNLWAAAINRPDFVPTSNSKICSDHFLPEDFAPYAFFKILRRDAIPSVSPVKNDEQAENSASMKTTEKRVNQGGPQHFPRKRQKAQCCVPGCVDMQLPRLMFPAKEDLLEEWISRIRIKDLKPAYVLKYPNKFQICVKHFEEECFSSISDVTLLPESVPTRCLPVPPGAPSLKHDHCYGGSVEKVGNKKPEKHLADSTTKLEDDDLCLVKVDIIDPPNFSAQPHLPASSAKQLSKSLPVKKARGSNSTPIVRVIEEDEVDHFFESIKKRYRKLPEIEKLEVKYQFVKVIRDIERKRHR